MTRWMDLVLYNKIDHHIASKLHAGFCNISFINNSHKYTHVSCIINKYFKCKLCIKSYSILLYTCYTTEIKKMAHIFFCSEKFTIFILSMAYFGKLITFLSVYIIISIFTWFSNINTNNILLFLHKYKDMQQYLHDKMNTVF